ncbi:hypothetical protein [Rheinheimera sp. 4Y26]|uniref:hypothetical protein n=1 Tax=Rheinheimera sp. 4Y26 TaxID=2977811 RepID=UPI0021B0F0DC|nr:hypothetical protein [Rheinheimera sp. 4Y26]MCT6699309.1 hypothetical protein [Rheinheimera sp. 4Y26]
MMPATPQQAEKKAEVAAEQAKRRGASPRQVEAIKLETYARERGAVVEPVTTTADGRSTSVTLRGEEHTGFRLSNGKDTALIDYSAGLDAVSDFLGDSPARDLSMQYAAQVMTIQQKSQQAFDDGYNRGFVSSVRSGVRAQQQQQLQTSRQLDVINQQRYNETKNAMSFGEKVTMAGFKHGDFILTAHIDAFTLLTDPNAIFKLEERTDKVISQGYLAKGEELSYRMAKEIYDRGLDDFVLRVDGRVIGTVGPMVTPFPLDSLKVHGSVGTSPAGRIFDGDYDFLEGNGTLNQTIPSGAGLLDSTIIYSRNQLNHIAYSQHSPNGKPYHIEYTYNDNDLMYGRKNYAPWKLDVDPSYADSYASYLTKYPRNKGLK